MFNPNRTKHQLTKKQFEDILGDFPKRYLYKSSVKLFNHSQLLLQTFEGQESYYVLSTKEEKAEILAALSKGRRNLTLSAYEVGLEEVKKNRAGALMRAVRERRLRELEA